MRLLHKHIVLFSASWVMLFILLQTNALMGQTLGEVRKMYVQSASDEASCSKLCQIYIAPSDKNVAALAGYKASATMMMAQYVFSPITKLSRFNQGKSALDALIHSNPADLELRYLRLINQMNAPRFLNYRSEIITDKDYLVQHLSKTDDVILREMISSYLRESKLLNPKELSQL